MKYEIYYFDEKNKDVVLTVLDRGELTKNNLTKYVRGIRRCTVKI